MLDSHPSTDALVASMPPAERRRFYGPARVRARQALYALIRDRAPTPFTFEEAAAAVRAPRDVLLGAIGDLVETGKLAEEPVRFGTFRYHPRPRPAEGPLPWREQAWTAMRIRKRFTVPTICRALATPTPPPRVYRYVRALERAGHVQRVGRAGPAGAADSHLVYRLAPGAGPSAPGVSGAEAADG